MTTSINEEISVELVDGAPHTFWWQRFPYVVSGSPQLFYRRKPPWWTGDTSMRRLDDEHWRVSAHRHGADDDGELYDLKNDGQRWTLLLRF